MSINKRNSNPPPGGGEQQQSQNSTDTPVQDYFNKPFVYLTDNQEIIPDNYELKLSILIVPQSESVVGAYIEWDGDVDDEEIEHFGICVSPGQQTREINLRLVTNEDEIAYPLENGLIHVEIPLTPYPGTPDPYDLDYDETSALINLIPENGDEDQMNSRKVMYEKIDLEGTEDIHFCPHLYLGIEEPGIHCFQVMLGSPTGSVKPIFIMTEDEMEMNSSVFSIDVNELAGSDQDHDHFEVQSIVDAFETDSDIVVQVNGGGKGVVRTQDSDPKPNVATEATN